MKMWIAREKDGKLSMFTSKPNQRGEFFWGSEMVNLDPEMFPWLKTEESPAEVELLWNKNAKEMILNHNLPDVINEDRIRVTRIITNDIFFLSGKKGYSRTITQLNKLLEELK